MRKSKLMTRILASVLTAALVVPGMSIQAAKMPDWTITEAESATDTADSVKGVVTTIEDSEITSEGELFKIQYSEGWYAESGYANLFSGGDDHYSPVKGAYYEMNFIGHKVELIASLNQQHGVYDVYIDQELVGEADSTTIGNPIHQQVIFTSELLEEGEHNIRVELKAGYPNIQVDSVRIYHEPLQVTDISIKDRIHRMEIGSQKQLDVTITPGIVKDVTVVWESSDEDVAQVDANGKVTAKGVGEATITGTVQGTDLTCTAEITVVPVVDYLSATFADEARLETQEDYEDLKGAYEDRKYEFAWRGDEIFAKVALCSRDKVVKNAEVTVSDFVTEDGDIIESENVEVKWLKEVKANIGRGNSYAPVKDFPDVIYKGGKSDLAANTVKFAWISVEIPEDTKAGYYEGTVTVSADGLDEAYEFDYLVEVIDLVQPAAAEVGTQIQIWQHPFSVANYYGVAEEDYFTEAHFKYMRASMEEYKELGGEDIVANIVEEAWNHQSYYSDPSMVKWTKNSDGSFTYDYTWYDAWINFLIECGVLDPENGVGQIKCYSIVPWNNQIAYYDAATGRTVKQSYTPGAADWKEMWTTFLTDFMAHSKEMGWFDITYISMDERSMDQLEPAVELIKTIKDEDGSSFKISSAFNYSSQSDYTFMDKLDDISINLGYISNASDKLRDMSEHRRELGLMTTIYTCTGNYPGNFTISDPADNYWTMWYSLAHNTDGFMRWAWDNWVADPLTNVTYKYWEPGDGWFIYPAEKNAGEDSDYFYSTPRYEMLKKGVRDINKAKYLMSLNEEMAEELTSLAESLQQPRQGNNGYGSAVAATLEDRELVFTETQRMRSSMMAYAYEYAESLKPQPTPTPAPVNPFEDVIEGQYYYDPVLWAVEKGVTSGLNATSFGVGNACTREQIVTFLWNYAGKPAAEQTECTFKDANPDHYYYNAMLWANEKGYVSGYNKDTFGVGDPCTREQIVMILWKFAGEPSATQTTCTFKDADAAHYYYNAMLWAVENGVVAGYSDTKFGVGDACTREQIVTFLYRYDNL